jgi:hypothetical protein
MTVLSCYRRVLEVLVAGYAIVWIAGAAVAYEHTRWTLSIGGKGFALAMWLYFGWITAGCLALLFAFVAWLVCRDVREATSVGPSPETDDEVDAIRRMSDQL